MIDKSIFGYAVLEYLAMKGKDILDMYIPLVGQSIVNDDVKSIDRITIKSLLKEDYGIDNITLGAVDSIIARMKRTNYINGSKAPYTPNLSKISEIIEVIKDINIENDFSSVCDQISQFALNFNVEATSEEVEAAFMDFLNQYGQEYIIDNKNLNKKLEEQNHNTIKLKHVISKFILTNRDSAAAVIIERIVYGYILTCITSLDNFNEYVGKMNGVVVALDAPIIYNLLGLNSEEGRLLNEELLNILKEQSCKFAIFKQHLEEVRNTITDAINRRRSGNYYLPISSRVLRFADRESLSAEQLHLKLLEVDNILSHYDIVEKDNIELTDRYKEIDVKRLEEQIINIYSNAGTKQISETEKEKIAIDVDVITNIFRMRGNQPATNLKQCTAILLTNNNAISYASNNPAISPIRHTIPACVTDVFLSTIMWYNFPKKSTSLNKKMLLNVCYSNTNLDTKILQHFYNDIEKRHRVGAITDEQILTIKASSLALKLLEDKTLNCEDLYTDKTVDEIIEYAHLRTTQERDILKEDVNTHNYNIRKIAEALAYILVWIVWLLLASCFLWVKFIDMYNWGNVWQITYNILYILVMLIATLWGPLNWIGIIPTQKGLFLYIAGKIEKCFLKMLNKPIDSKER